MLSDRFIADERIIFMKLSANEFSFRHFLIRYAQENPPSMTYEGVDFRSWQEQFFSKLVELRGDPIPRVAMKPEVAERVELEDHIREHIYFYSMEGVRVSSYMLIPKDRPRPLPVVLAFHGHGYGVKDIVGLWEDGQERDTPDGYHKDFAVALCRRGFAVETTGDRGVGMPGRHSCCDGAGREHRGVLRHL